MTRYQNNQDRKTSDTRIAAVGEDERGYGSKRRDRKLSAGAEARAEGQACCLGVELNLRKAQVASWRPGPSHGERLIERGTLL